MEFYSEEFLDGMNNGYTPERWQAFLDTNPTLYKIFLAGKNWPNFDYRVGYEEIIKRPYCEQALFKAGCNWADFPYYDAMIFLNRSDISWGEAIIAENWPIPENKKIGILRGFGGRPAAKLFLNGKIDEEEKNEYLTSFKWKKIIKRRKIQEANGAAKNGVVTKYKGIGRR